MPTNVQDEMDERKWRVLCEAIFPAAKTPEAIVMALDYCKARNLDIFRKPVHIVPMWNSALGKEVETVWPGINEVQVTAARTGHYAGMDEPRWGAMIKRTFKGSKKNKNGSWENVEAEVEFPEYCAVTVYRMVEGQRCPFTEPVYWLEAYSRSFGKELPTDMWIKRPRGQLHKVAKAASLRTAFPEEGEYTAEEMEGKEIEAGGIAIVEQPAKPALTPPPAPKPKAQFVPNAADREMTEAEERALDRTFDPRTGDTRQPEHDAETGEAGPRMIDPLPKTDGSWDWMHWGKVLIVMFKDAKDTDELSAWLAANADYLEICEKESPKAGDSVVKAYKAMAEQLGKVVTPTSIAAEPLPF
jgi:phage recombination protein Bet